MKLIVELIRHGETDLQAQRRYQGSIDVPLSREGRQRLSAGRENLSALREARNAGREPQAASKEARNAGGEPQAVSKEARSGGRDSRTAPREAYGAGGVFSPVGGGRLPAEGAFADREKKFPEAVYVSPLVRARETASILFPGARQIVIPGFCEMNFGKFEGRNFKEMENDPEYRAWVDGMCLGRCPGGESREEFCERTCEAFLKVLHQAAQGVSEHSCGIRSRRRKRDRKPEEKAEKKAEEKAEEKEPGMVSANKSEALPEFCPEESLNTGTGDIFTDKENAEAKKTEKEIPHVVIVAHGGTQMAVMNRFNRPAEKHEGFTGADKAGKDSRDYYSWQLPCAQGYLLEAQLDGTECRLHVLGIRDYGSSQGQT